MTHTLTRRNISAIAKLDLSALGHSQRIDAIAKALGYEAAAALMATLKTSESAASTPSAETPIRAILAFGRTPCSAIQSSENLRDENGYMDGDVSHIVFATKAEFDAYVKGLEDADGWMDHMIVANQVEEPDHPYFQALTSDPELDFVDWYEADIQTQDSEDLDEDEQIEAWLTSMVLNSAATAEINDRALSQHQPGRDQMPITGYQVVCGNTDEHWADRPSFEILTLECAQLDLREALRANRGAYRLVIIRKGDIEEPSYE